MRYAAPLSAPPITNEQLNRLLATTKKATPFGPRPRWMRPVLALATGALTALAVAQAGPVLDRAIDRASDAVLMWGAPIQDAPPSTFLDGPLLRGAADPSWVPKGRRALTDLASATFFFEDLQARGVSPAQAHVLYAALTESGRDLLLTDPNPFLESFYEKDLAALSGFLSAPPSNRLSPPPAVLEILDSVKHRESITDWDHLKRDFVCRDAPWSCRDAIANPRHQETAPANWGLPAAQADLRASAKKAGLAGLYIPSAQRDDPKALWVLARALDDANSDLQHLTGWAGGVLGLNGRVVLDFAAKGQSASTQRFSDGHLLITSSWDNLAHEWHHAMDWAMETALINPSTSPLSSSLDHIDAESNPRRDKFGLQAAQVSLWNDLAEPHLSMADRIKIARTAARNKINPGGDPMFMALAQQDTLAQFDVPAEGSPWMYWRSAAAERISPDHAAARKYLLEPTEMLSFWLAAHTSASLRASDTDRPGSPIDDPGFGKASSASYEMSWTEASVSKGAWHKFFRAAHPWWVADTAARVQDEPTTTKPSTRRRSP